MPKLRGKLNIRCAVGSEKGRAHMATVVKAHRPQVVRKILSGPPPRRARGHAICELPEYAPAYVADPYGLLNAFDSGCQHRHT
jgi:hypothetical protein